MSGVDYDFVIKEDLQWVLRRFIRRMRGRWPRLVCGADRDVYSRDGALLSEYPEFFVVSRDVEMQELTRQLGLPGRKSGDFSFFVISTPLPNGATDVDLVVADARPFWFTELVIGCFSGAVLDWYRRRSLSTLVARGGLRRGLHVAEVCADPEWMEQALRVCIERRWPGVETGSTGMSTPPIHGVEVSWTRRVALQAQDGHRESQVAVFFGAATGSSSGGSFVGVELPSTPSRTWRKEARAVLGEAVAMWHAVSWRSMKNPFVAYACPPGTPRLNAGKVSFEGPGCPVPERKEELPVEVPRKLSPRKKR
ncbi:hypothetical protein [Pyxidicoccus xibeiensis]|uniref:hypothetical protein n=1 Tax=Pyxidicoccus xibeiensis TaxID=2906759 RepID=UPI0020A7AE3F|nr:hypothetical protein [Pyxidicoccus xibeiensis]MCP3142273.1 hypothetical protein [Pyxidicoccus xibeiensis]